MYLVIINIGSIGVDLFSRLGDDWCPRRGSEANERGRVWIPHSHGRDFFPKIRVSKSHFKALKYDFLGN